MPGVAFKIPESVPAALKSMGIDLDVVLQKSGLPLTFWNESKGSVNTAQLIALWRALEAISPDPVIGLKFARQIPPEQHHPASIVAQHSRTFRDCLQRFARYKYLCCSEEMRITETKDECRIEFEWLLAEEPVPAMLFDAAFATALELGRRGTRQALHPLRVELCRSEDGLREHYEGHYGCPLKFEARRNMIVFRTRDLDLPFITYNAELVAMLAPQLDRELAERKGKRTASEQVKWVLKRLLGGRLPDLGAVARELGLSTRTLQRRITQEGTNFRRLLGDVRHELARFYLQQPKLELGETAYLLSYEDPNSFFRAFREWEGATPGEWRASRGQPAR